MARCKACDFCDTTGEMSPYKWGITTLEYSGKFYVDPQTGDDYCAACWINMSELFIEDEEVEEDD